jgi:competence protein ComEA
MALLLPAAALAQFPEGPGRAEMVKVCSGCHELERSAAMKQDRDGWKATVDKMVALGAKGSEAEINATIDYLARTFPAEELPKLNVNRATQIELESRLSLRRSEAAAVVQYREKNGPFQTIADLKKVPGVDAAKIEAKKDRITF